MDGALELLARVPLGVGVLAGVAALGALASLVTHRADGGTPGRSCGVAEVVFGLAILGYTATYAWAYVRASEREHRGGIAPRAFTVTF